MATMKLVKETLIPTVLLGLMYLILLVGSEAFFGAL